MRLALETAAEMLIAVMELHGLRTDATLTGVLGYVEDVADYLQLARHQAVVSNLQGDVFTGWVAERIHGPVSDPRFDALEH